MIEIQEFGPFSAENSKVIITTITHNNQIYQSVTVDAKKEDRMIAAYTKFLTGYTTKDVRIEEKSSQNIKFFQEPYQKHYVITTPDRVGGHFEYVIVPIGKIFYKTLDGLVKATMLAYAKDELDRLYPHPSVTAFRKYILES